MQYSQMHFAHLSSGVARVVLAERRTRSFAFWAALCLVRAAWLALKMCHADYAWHLKLLDVK